MSSRLGRVILAGIVIATVLGWSLLLGAGLAGSVLIVTVLSVVAVAGLWWALQRAGDATAAVRERLGRADEGTYHAFAGVRLQVEDDGRHVWIAGTGLQRLLGRLEPDEAQAARHAGAWRRSERGVLMLRVDAVIQHLAHMPGRDEPRIQKLRRYLERDVLYPAQRRRQPPVQPSHQSAHAAQPAPAAKLPPEGPA